MIPCVKRLCSVFECLLYLLQGEGVIISMEFSIILSFFEAHQDFHIENEISVISYYQQWLFMPLSNINIHYRWFKKKAKMGLISESENRRNAFYVGAEQFLQMKLLDLCVNAGMSSIARHSPLGVFPLG